VRAQGTAAALQGLLLWYRDVLAFLKLEFLPADAWSDVFRQENAAMSEASSDRQMLMSEALK
jgi:hypothetical protein